MSLYDTFRRRSIPAPIALAMQYSDPIRMRLDTPPFTNSVHVFVQSRLVFLKILSLYLRTTPEILN